MEGAQRHRRSFPRVFRKDNCKFWRQQLDAVNILKRLGEATSKHDTPALAEIVAECSTFSFREASEDGPFPENLFEGIVQLIEQDQFLSMSGSYQLLMLFESEWSRLEERQKVNLLEVFGATYGRYADWMSCFVITELLGEYYCDERAFKLLCELEITSNETARALVPHGFEHIAKAAEKQSLQIQALARLRAMINDPSERVRNEAEVALGNVE